jgi:multicomponent Na+:H+ antiporter subunit E
MLRKTLFLTFSLWIFWVILTGNLGFWSLLAGFVCALFVAFFTRRLLADYINDVSLSLEQTLRFVIYIPFLIKEIVKANIDVAKRVLSPRLPIDPRIITYNFALKENLPQVTLANSITLTPGTLTVDIHRGDYCIHCLAQEHAEGIFEESLQKRVSWVFEGKETAMRGAAKWKLSTSPPE